MIKLLEKEILFKYFKIVNIFLFILYVFYAHFSAIIEEKTKIINEKELIRMEDNYMKFINESEIKKFVEINNNDILISEDKIGKYKNPDVSIIILMYNQANCIHKCIRSIQNQSLKNIEIIIIDDCSVDNSTETIEYYKKNDKRIILLTHDRNYGKIKSRSDGVRMARGKYITFIDGDDAFIHKDILLNSLNLATLSNLDVVDFKISFYSNKTFINNINTYDEINNIIILYLFCFIINRSI